MTQTSLNFLMVFLFVPMLFFGQEQKEQPEFLNILDEEGFANSDLDGQLHYLISIKSKDSLFDRDAYMFTIPNRRGFEEYAGMKEIGETVQLDSLDYVTRAELAKLSSCDLHEFFSLQKRIYVIFRNEKVPGQSNETYTRYSIDYTGTQKNVEMLR